MLVFNNYLVDKIDFSLSQNLEQGTTYKIKPLYSRNIEEKDGKYYVKLTFKLVSDTEEELPIHLFVSIIGVFTLTYEENKEQLINYDSVMIMFPYLRAIVSTITSSANIPNILLPTINMAAVMKEQEKKEL